MTYRLLVVFGSLLFCLPGLTACQSKVLVFEPWDTRLLMEQRHDHVVEARVVDRFTHGLDRPRDYNRNASATTGGVGVSSDGGFSTGVRVEMPLTQKDQEDLLRWTLGFQPADPTMQRLSLERIRTVNWSANGHPMLQIDDPVYLAWDDENADEATAFDEAQRVYLAAPPWRREDDAP